MIFTGRFPRDLPLAPIVPLQGSGWQHNANVLSRVNPGVVTDAHAFAHDVVTAFLGLRVRNGIVGPILPDPLNVSRRPSVSGGAARRMAKSNSTVVIANADDSLPRSWMKRWSYCSDKTVVAHEIAHALAYESCTFDYCLESGALDEALADLFAVLITGSTAIFDAPWIREDTRYVDAVAALRDASWSAAFKPDRLTPNDRVERGKYPNHYADFARLDRTNEKAVRRIKPKNDHGYIHWNCAIVTRALAMLAQEPDAEAAVHPETEQKVVGIGTDHVADLVFCALLSSRTGSSPIATMLKRRSLSCDPRCSTPRHRRSSTRSTSTELIVACSPRGSSTPSMRRASGRSSAVRGRPRGVAARYMPVIDLDPPEWVMKFEHGRAIQY